MKLAFSAKPEAGAVAVRFFTTEQRAQLPRGVTAAELSLKPSSSVFLHAENTLCIGLGDAGKVDADTLRQAAGVAVMLLKKSGRTNLNVHLEEWAAHVGATVEGLVLADFRSEEYKTQKTPVIERANILMRAADVTAVRKDGQRAQIVAEQTNVARGIANRPGNVVYPATLAEEAQWLAKKAGLRCTVLDERKLREGKFGGILAVGEGSARGPRFIILEHRGGPKKQAPLALVGKAVTFDTGGISIKSAADMEQMIWDKCGGCAVLGAMLAIAKLGVKRNIVGLIPAAENMPGSNAYRPGDIITCYDGKHVEIVNTDAEGRMILADAIAYARRDLGATAIVDAATLTGACGVALGESTAGLWSTDDKLRDALLSASKHAGERLWPMPLIAEYDEQIRSDVALIKNAAGRLAGACTAAAFLKVFAEPTPWAHLDIAYAARRPQDGAAIARGATGFGVRTLVNLAEQWK